MTRPREIGWCIALLVAGMLIGTLVANLPQPTPVDRWWHGVMADLRWPALVTFGIVMGQIGGGWFGLFVVPAGTGLMLLLMRGWRPAVSAVSAFAVSALLVQVAKNLLGRARPEDLMVAADYGSYPSGHTANAATIAVVLWRLFPRLVIALTGGAWVLLMAFSRTVISAHWLTDTLGGAMLGVAFGLLAAALYSWATGTRGREDPGADYDPHDPRTDATGSAEPSTPGTRD